MPIDVSPPMSGNLQGFQIAPVQSTDPPLQTLAQMSQLRTQWLQQQHAQLGLTQAQMKMDSQKAIMAAAAQGNGNWDTTYGIAAKDSRVLPSDLMDLAKERLNIQTLGTTLKKDQQAVLATDMDRHLQNMTGVTDQESLDQANQRSIQAGVHFAQPGDPLPGVPQLTAFPSGHPDAIQAYVNSLKLHKEAVDEGSKQATTAEANTRTAGLQRTQAAAALGPLIGPDGTPDPGAYAALQKQYPLAGLPAAPNPGNMQAFRGSAVPEAEKPKYNLERMAQAVSRIQGLPASQLDPKTGGPTPAAMAQIQQEFSDVRLPQGALSKDDIDRFARASIPVDKQPEYDLAKMKAVFGLLGNTPSDQFLAKYAQTIKNPDGTPKTTLQLTADEMGKGLQAFKQFDTNPEAMQALLTARSTENFVKLLQIQMTKDQLAAMPTQDDYVTAAQQIHDNNLSPSQAQAQFKARGVNGMPAIQREMQKIEPNFNWEEAQGTYDLAHSPGMQTTVRYMDYVNSVVPKIISAADALNNGKVRSINAVKNWAANQLNGVDIAKFNTDRVELGDAIAKVLQSGGTGSGTSDAKLNQGMSLIKDTDDPQVVRAVAGEVQGLIQNRRNTLTRGTFLERAPSTGGGGGQQGGPSGTVTVTDPRGTVHTFKNQADADKFKTAAGIK